MVQDQKIVDRNVEGGARKPKKNIEQGFIEIVNKIVSIQKLDCTQWLHLGGVVFLDRQNQDMLSS